MDLPFGSYLEEFISRNSFHLSELLGPCIVAAAVGRAEAVYGVLELEGFLDFEALDYQAYLALGEARDVLSGLVREFAPRG